MAAVGVRHLEHNLLVYRRTWRGTAFGTIVSPILFLSAMGLGLGAFVPDLVEFGGVSYLAFLAPGLLAAQAMQTGTIDSSWPLLAGFKWLKTFQASIATPQTTNDLVLGHLYWLVVRLGIVTGVFFVVMLLFGAVSSVTAIFSWPAAVLTGVAFGMPMAAWTASRKNEASFPVIFRFVITPMFLFSGTFFPIDRLPEALQAVAAFTPLYHGVALAREMAIGDLDVVRVALHVTVLLTLVVGGTLVALRTFRRRLVV